MTGNIVDINKAINRLSVGHDGGCQLVATVVQLVATVVKMLAVEQMDNLVNFPMCSRDLAVELGRFVF